jgi:hypothetical protein
MAPEDVLEDLEFMGAVEISREVRYWLALHMAADWSVNRGIY